jgi:hypothetical protein
VRRTPVAVRDVGDVVRILNQVAVQLQDLSRSDLETLDSTLVHVHDHVASELNDRNRRKNRGIESEHSEAD